MGKSKGYIYYILWTAGALLLLYYGNRFVTMMEGRAGDLLGVGYNRIGNIVYPFAIGCYLSLLTGLPNRRKLSKPLFYSVFIPSLILTIYPITAIFIAMPYSSLYTKISSQEGDFFITMLCGLTMMKSLFISK